MTIYLRLGAKRKVRTLIHVCKDSKQLLTSEEDSNTVLTYHGPSWAKPTRESVWHGPCVTKLLTVALAAVRSLHDIWQVKTLRKENVYFTNIHQCNLHKYFKIAVQIFDANLSSYQIYFETLPGHYLMVFLGLEWSEDPLLAIDFPVSFVVF